VLQRGDRKATTFIPHLRGLYLYIILNELSLTTLFTHAKKNRSVFKIKKGEKILRKVCFSQLRNIGLNDMK